MRRKLFGAILALCIGWFQAEASTGKASCFSVDHHHEARELIFFCRPGVDINTTYTASRLLFFDFTLQ